MELLAEENSASVFNATLIAYVNYLVLRHFAEYFAVCTVMTSSDQIPISVQVPVMAIAVDSSFNDTFRMAVDGGCQAFVVTERALKPFLDAFPAAHDHSDQRSSDKRLLVILESYERWISNDFVSHSSLLELKNVLIVTQNDSNGSTHLYSTRIFNNGTRSAVNLNIERMEESDVVADRIRDMNGVPIHLCLIMYPPYSYYEETVSCHQFSVTG